MEYFSILRNFGVLYRVYMSYLSKEFVDEDISFSDNVFLMNIGLDEGISQEALSVNLAIDRAAIARSVKKMEEIGLVKTTKSLEDKRLKALFLTESGKELYEKITQLNVDWLNHVMVDLSDKEKMEFARMMDLISQRSK